MEFVIGDDLWQVEYVGKNNPVLMRSDKIYTLGVTDAISHKIFISNAISDALLLKVLTHELCHAFCITYNVYLPLEEEELLCDFVSTYGRDILELADYLFMIMNWRNYYAR